MSASADETADLRDEIEQTRADLAETAQALSDKLNVKQQARSAAGSVQERVLELPGRATAWWERDPVPIIAAGATFAGVLVALGWKDHR